MLQTTKKIAFTKRRRGLLCELCSSNYKTLKRVNERGETIITPLVKVDPLERRVPEVKHFTHETSVSDWKEEGPVHAGCYRALVMHDRKSYAPRGASSDPNDGSFGSSYIGRK